MSSIFQFIRELFLAILEAFGLRLCQLFNRKYKVEGTIQYFDLIIVSLAILWDSWPDRSVASTLWQEATKQCVPKNQHV